LVQVDRNGEGGEPNEDPAPETIEQSVELVGDAHDEQYEGEGRKGVVLDGAEEESEADCDHEIDAEERHGALVVEGVVGGGLVADEADVE